MFWRPSASSLAVFGLLGSCDKCMAYGTYFATEELLTCLFMRPSCAAMVDMHSTRGALTAGVRALGRWAR